MLRQLPHFSPGTSVAKHTAIVLACPGRHEQLKGRPAAAATGKNLDRLLGHLGHSLPALFPSANRYDYVVTNSSNQVHYKALTGDTEPGEAEILAPINIARLLREIESCSTALAMGACASKAVAEAAKCGFGGRIIVCNWHLSFSRLNTSIFIDVDGVPILKGQPDATDRRIGIVARDVLAGIGIQPATSCIGLSICGESME